MRRILFILSVMSLMLQSCQSQSNFDLSKITLKENIKDLPLEKLDLEEKDLYLNTEYSGYTTYDKQFLQYEGVNLEGRIRPDSNYERNKVAFWFSKKERIISLLDISIFTYEESNNFIKILIEKLGEPNFTRYRTKADKEKDNPTHYVWEALKMNKTYFLSMYNDKNSKEAQVQLYVVDNSNEALYKKLLEFGQYSYYRSFINERNKKQDTSYTYQQFLKDEAKKGGEYYSYKTK